MIRASLAVAAVVTVGCGRVGFDAIGGGDGDGGGGGGDGGGSGNVSVVQYMSGTPDDPTPALVEVQLPGPVAPGDTLVICIDNDPQSGETMTLADSRGTVFTTLAGPVEGPSGMPSIAEWVMTGTITSAGADLVTVTAGVAPGRFFEVRVHEIAGLAAGIATAPTATASGSSGPGDTIASPALTVPARSMLLGFVVAQDTVHVGAGFTLIEPDYDDLVEYAIADAAGTYAATATSEFGGDWVTTIAALPMR